MSKLILIDGNSLINRAFYAIPPLANSDGKPTNAVYGFTNMLIKILKEQKPTHMLVAFDKKGPTFRHAKYAEYKGTRKPMPEDLRPQIPMLQDLLKTMGIAIFDKDTIEADDIIGTLATKYDFETLIYTGDKDSFQLVNDTTSVCYTKKGISDIVVYSKNAFKELHGVEPYQVTDLKALMGDSSDNIPGVPGIGEKTAKNLIETYGSIENLYENLGDFKGKTLEKLIDGKELGFLSKELATIKTDVEVPLTLDDLIVPFPFNLSVKDAFYSLEFTNLYKRDELFVEGLSKEEQAEIENVNIVEITELSKIQEIIKADTLCITIDNSVNICCLNNTEYVIKIKKEFFDDGLEYSAVLNALSPAFLDENKKIICFSYKKLRKFLNSLELDFTAKFDDVDILRYLVNFSGKEQTLEEILVDFKKNTLTPAYSLYSLYVQFIKELKEQNIENLYYNVELPLAKVLYFMEKDGFKVDILALDNLGEKYRKELIELGNKINELAGEPLNPNSPKQLSTILFEKLRVGKSKKNKSGGYSTNAEILEELVDAHPIIPLILRYRTVQKLLSTYIDGFKPLVDKKTGLIHTCFNQTLTQTGRLSSKEPNMQNIPVRDGEGKELRKFFIPRSQENLLIDADYSQIELRLLADFSKSEELINAYKEGKDIHSLTASQVFNVPLSQVTSDLRRNAKAVNFGIIYGISEYGLAKNIKSTPKQASEYIQNYFRSYPKIKEYMDKNVEFARKNGYVSTLFNRKRYIREINHPNYNMRSFGERAAMNMPLQGSSADIIKIAMINVFNRLEKEGLKTRLIMQVHDELVLDAPKNEVEIASKILKEEMENAVKLSVPLTVDVNVGKNWYDAK